jgi:hypothetical protein
LTAVAAEEIQTMRKLLVVLGVVLLVAAVAAGLIVGRKSGDGVPTGTPPSTGAPSAQPAGGATTAAPNAGVSLSVDANWVSEPVLYRGWPLLIRATTRAATGQSTSLATTGPWSGSLKIQVNAADGSPAAWPIVETAGAPASVTLGEFSESVATWTVAPEFTRSLAPGRYVIHAELDTTRTVAANAWKGTAAARPLVVQVTDEPASLTSGDRVWKPMIDSQYAMLRGDPAGALSIVDAALASSPGAITLLSRKAALLETMGRPSDALGVVNEALDGFSRKFPNSPEPPAGLLWRQKALTAQLMKK